jgi:hypothetical protein
MNRRALVFAALAATTPVGAQAASDLKVVYVGGQDCPPCMRWKSTYLDTWRASREYQRVDWFEIEPAKLKEAYQERFWLGDLRAILDQLPRKSGTPRFLIAKANKVVVNLAGSSKWREIMADLKKLLGE